MSVSAGDTASVTWVGSCFNQRIMLTQTYRVAVGNAVLTTQQVLAELINEVNASGIAGVAVRPSYLALLPPEFIMVRTQAQILRPTRSAYIAVASALAGTHINSATVACDSAAGIRRTPLGGRNQVSVLKVGPVPDAASQDGLLTVAYSNLMSTFISKTLQTLVLPVSTCQFVPSILDSIGNASGRDLTTFYIGEESRVMRRRVVGRGI